MMIILNLKQNQMMMKKKKLLKLLKKDRKLKKKEVRKKKKKESLNDGSPLIYFIAKQSETQQKLKILCCPSKN